MQKLKKKKSENKPKENLTLVKKKNQKLPIQYFYVLYSSEYLSKNMN